MQDHAQPEDSKAGGIMSTESWNVSGVDEMSPGEVSGREQGQESAVGKMPESLKMLAERVREMTVHAGSEADRGIRDFGEAVSGRIERLALVLGSRDMDELRTGIKDMAKENPMLLSAAAFAAGMVLSRIIKHTVVEEGGKE
jgi:hypothetical protein